MGDECNVASRRNEDSPSSSSPILGVGIKNLEEFHDQEIPPKERDFLILSRQSGEPDEEAYKFCDNKHVHDNVLSQKFQPHELSVGDPLLLVPPNLVRTSRSVFPYFETKLRPDAPPFTPESLMRIGQGGCGIVDMNETICMERNFVPRSMIDDSCFVNIELRSAIDDATPSTITEMEKQMEREKTAMELETIIKEPEIKTIDVTSTRRLKRTSPKIELASDSLPTNLQIDEAIVLATESTVHETDTRETYPEIVEPSPVVRAGHWRLLRTLSIHSNRIQIVVFIASLVICMILVIYVVL